MTDCPEPYALVEEQIDRVLTQYRESPNLLFMLRTYLGKIDEAIQAICGLPEFFEINTAVGDQLTLIGKRLGFGRCHCVCNVQPVYGFECEGFPSDFPIVGICQDGTWAYCGNFGSGEICITDDELYRKFLLVRRYQMLSLYDIANLNEAIRIMWGETAMVLYANAGKVVIAPGRDLTSSEQALMQIVARIIPIAPGIRQRYHFGDELRVAGFGEGWGGICEPWQPDGLLEVTGDGINVIANDIDTSGDHFAIITGALTRGAPMMCQIDVHPYDCEGI